MARNSQKAKGGESLPERKPPEQGGKPTLALTLGDPCGIGPEIVLKALASEEVGAAARILVVGSEAVLRSRAREFKLKWPFVAVSQEPPPASRRRERPQLLDTAGFDPAAVDHGQICASAGRAAGLGLERAVALALEGSVDGLVTGPIHKEALSLAGYSDPGHTDLIARLSGAKRVITMYQVDALGVAMLSTHMALREALRRVRAGRIAESLVLLDTSWRELYGRAPRIVVAALNPHGGEGSRFGIEEEREVAPGIERARSKGVIARGPVSADLVFGQARAGEHDIVLALYHDQATIPVKLLWGRRAVAMTFGLPFVRASVDHGPAYDIAGHGSASEESLKQALLAAAAAASALAARSS